MTRKTRLTTVFLLSLALRAFAGNESGSGGEPTAENFRNRGRYILSRLLSDRSGLLTPDELTKFMTASFEVRIELTKDELKDDFGGLVTARLDDDDQRPGKKKIRLNEDRWEKTLRGKLGQNALRFVFHEYCGAIGIDDFNDKVSQRLDLKEGAYVGWMAAGENGDSIVTYETLFGQFTLLVEDEVGKTEELANESFNTQYIEWLANLDESMRKEIPGDIEILGTKVYDPEPSSRHFGVLKSPKDLKVGVQISAAVSAKVLLDVKWKSIGQISDQPISGTTEMIALEGDATKNLSWALYRAQKSYLEACAAWKEKQRKILKGRYVYGSCGGAYRWLGDQNAFTSGIWTMFRNSVANSHYVPDSDVIRAKLRYYSQGTLYYLK